MTAPATCPHALGAGSLLAEFQSYLLAPATCPFSLGAWSLAKFGPYLALGRVLATFQVALGSDSVAGLPLLRGAATLNGSSVPRGHETVSETGHFCAGHMISVCLALTLRWAES